MAVDPSCGSRSSMPGYAIYRAGDLVESGTIQIGDVSRPLPYRLQDLGEEIRNMYLRVDPDVLVVEELPVRRFGGGSATAHASLLKSAGAVFATAPAQRVITIRPQAWRQLTHDGWYKDDEQDAIAMGHAVVAVARIVRDGGLADE